MFWALFWVLILGVIFTGIIYAIDRVGIGYILVELGKRDEWWSPVRILPPPGEMYFVVRGTPDGPFDRLLDSVPDYDWDHATHKFVAVSNPRNETTLLAQNGVAWVGFQRRLLKREINHLKYVQKDDGSWGPDKKIRPGPSVFFRWNMATQIQGAEILGNLVVDAIIVYTVQLTDPVRAMFFAGGWEKQVAAAVQGRFRRYTADKEFEELLKEQKKAQNGGTPIPQAVSTEIIGLNTAGADGRAETGLLKLFGAEILDARFVKVDIAGSAEARASMEALRIAERNAEAVAAEAEGRKQAKIKDAEAEYERLKREGEGRRDARTAEAVGIAAEVAARASVKGGEAFAFAEALPKSQIKVLNLGKDGLGGVLVNVDGEK